MSSFLEKQSSAFKGSLASAASKIGAPPVKGQLPPAKAASLAPPSPSPSAHSDSNITPTSKRRRDVQPDIPYSQPALTGFGHELKTQLTFAVEYLKTKGGGKSSQDIIGHLSLMHHGDEHKKELADMLRRHPRIEWRPDASLKEQNWKTGKYHYKPIIQGVSDGTSLLAHLQRKTDASGVLVKDLKDGWPDCEDSLTNLEMAHKILVTRTKKDNFPRMVWPDDASLHYSVQPEFVSMWHRVQMPSLEDMHRKLVAVGQRPTSDDPLKILQGQSKAKVQKKRAGKRPSKATNTHMNHLMQDYSNMRR